MNPLCRAILLVVLILLAPSGFTAEVDSFTGRHELTDLRPTLNRVVNLWIDEALQTANEKPFFRMGDTKGVDYCVQARLIDALKKKFTGFIVGKLEAAVMEDDSLDTIRIRVEDSIYRDFEFTESPSISLTGRLAVLLRLGDVYLGSDKFGHFFSEGMTYYEMYATGGQTPALQFGDFTERTIYGELTTGVFSYADLAANLNGLRFWNSILAKLPDPITPAIKPLAYVACVDHQWQRVRDFDWLDYVDPTWDEAINCSAFRNDILLQKVKKRIAAATHGRQCPLVQVDENRLRRKYGALLAHIYNPDGNKVFTEPIKPRMELFWSIILGRLKTSSLFIPSPGPQSSALVP